MKRSKYIICIVTLLFIFLSPLKINAAAAGTSSPPSATEENASPSAEFIPSPSSVYDSYKDNKYFSEYKDNYYLDLEDTGMFSGIFGKIFNGLANIFFGIQIILAQILIIIVFYAFNLSLFDLFKTPIDLIVTNLSGTIFNEFSTVCIVMIGLFYIVRMIKSQTTQVWTSILQTLLILVMAISFFRAPTAILGGVDDISKYIGQVSIEGAYKSVNDGKESTSPTEAVSTTLWVMFVHKPWQIYEFGSIKLAEKYEDQILKTAPESKERQKIIDEIAKDKVHFQAGVGLQRLLISLINLIIFLALAAIILALCALIVGNQFLMLIVALFGPIVFTVALIPNFGFNLVKNWCGKIISFASMKAIFTLMLSILFALMITTYQMTDKYGLLMVSLIQLVMIVMIWYKREELANGIFAFVATAKEATPQNLNRSLNRNINSMESGMSNWAQNKLNRDDSDRNQSVSSGSQSETESSGKNSDKSVNTNTTTGYSINTLDDEIYDVNDNLISLRAVAEQILEKKYNNSKQESEEKAAVTGKEPEYSNWVKMVDNREEMGLPKFDEREKQAVIQQIKDIQATGGSIEEIQALDNNYSSENRPASLDVDAPVLNVVEVDEPLTDRQASEQLVQQFNEEFNKKYNAAFMESLVGNYGQTEVRQVVTDMTRINQEEKTKILNPTGYLIESLNNNRANGSSEIVPTKLEKEVANEEEA